MSVQHGTWSTYTNHYCRCDECVQAAREYRNSLPTRATRGPIDPDRSRQLRLVGRRMQAEISEYVTVPTSEKVPVTELRRGELVDCLAQGVNQITLVQPAKSKTVRKRGKRVTLAMYAVRIGNEPPIVVPTTCKFHRVGRVPS